ncbi:MAG TPA: hypothetical protein VG389_22105 [Myxococcota bacterium]|jgi:hypothetical protein|nr:hypothetical protein [Myxococcota bacterium]
MRILRIVNVVPNDHSNEVNDDSEPSIAVNPNNVDEMVVTAFTPTESSNPNGPFFYSSDGGETWSLKFEIPGGQTRDQSPAFARTSNELYLGVIRGDNSRVDVLRTANPSAGNAADVIEDRPFADQPWAEATTVIGGPDDGKDRLYVGYNDSAPQSATVEIWLDAGAATPTFNQVRLDPRAPSPNDGYEIRPAIHSDGTVYIGYMSRSSFVGNDSVQDLVVARDDNWGAGGSPFTDLKDPSDNKAGRLVAKNVPISEGSLGGIRLNNDFNLSVDPSNSDVVYLVWCDNADPNYTLRVRRSLNRGVDWSGDLLVVQNAALATMAINSRGRVGLFYQQLVSGQMETHFRSTFDGTSWDDTLVARTATSPNFTGDYGRMVAVGLDFYGVFPAMNSPDPANFFPNGDGTFRYQRNTNGNELRGLDGVTVIPASVDPFLLKVLERDCVVVTDRNTFGKDEVDALLLQATPARIPAAFYVIVDGFRAADLNITSATFSGTPNVAPGIAFNPGLTGLTAEATACVAEDPDHLNFPQRFTWTYRVSFANHDDFTQEVRDVTMTASITSNTGITVSGDAVLTLTTQPNPYEIDGATSWLSVDLQVFQILQGGSLPSTPGVALTAGPNDFITQLLANTGGGYNDPALARAPNHPFDLDLLSQQDTSTVSIAGMVGLTPVYNFAVARVRYRALSTPAANVRAFFRLFQCSTTSTEYQPTSTYLTGGQGATKVPLLGVVNGEVVSIPCFAEARADPTNPIGLNAQTDAPNVGPVGESIPPDATGNEVQVYFGCWLDINQSTAVLPAGGATGANSFAPTRSVQDVIRGQHQCLVAEIHLDPPEPQIATGASPSTSDKLAQRNLTIVGVASPHQVPVTFDIKPTAAALLPGQTPDEIMIDWGQVPAGSQASLYLPGTSADDILSMADKLYTRHGLSRSDEHTLTCTARGITYVPIPPGVGSNYAGLLTIDLPETVKREKAFKVVTRQLRNVFAKRPAEPPPEPGLKISAAAEVLVLAKKRFDLIQWRRVVGTFQVTIPVATKPALLPVEERLLSVLRWIARSIPSQDRWHPVFQRYLAQVADRVSALGGDPSKIAPSSSGEGRLEPAGPKDVVCATGKVAALLFDRFGDFEGFVLDTEHGDRRYLSREKNVAELADRAWRERLRITVCARRHAPHRPESITVHHPPHSFGR